MSPPNQHGKSPPAQPPVVRRNSNKKSTTHPPNSNSNPLGLGNHSGGAIISGPSSSSKSKPKSKSKRLSLTNPRKIPTLTPLPRVATTTNTMANNKRRPSTSTVDNNNPNQLPPRPPTTTVVKRSHPQIHPRPLTGPTSSRFPTPHQGQGKPGSRPVLKKPSAAAGTHPQPPRKTSNQQNGSKTPTPNNGPRGIGNRKSQQVQQQQPKKETSNTNGKESAVVIKKYQQHSLGEMFKLIKPEDVRDKIFRHLSLKEMKIARSVCKLWDELVTPLIKCRAVLTDRSGSTLESLASKGLRNVQEFVIRPPLKLFTFGDSEVKKFSESVEILRFSEPPVGDIGRGPNMTVTLNNVEAILQGCKNVKGLEFNSSCFGGKEAIQGESQILRNLDFPHLTLFQISAKKTDIRGYSLCSELLHNYFPSLKVFHIDIAFEVEIVVDFPPLYVDTFKFIARHKDTLNRLYINNCGKVVKSTPYMVMNTDNLQQSDVDEIVSALPDLTLAGLSLIPSFFEGNNRFQFGVAIMDNQHNLTIFEIAHIHRINIGLIHICRNLLQRCESTLQSVTLAGCICPPAPDDSFSCDVFQTMKHLQKLTLFICGMPLQDLNQLPKSIRIMDPGPDLKGDQVVELSTTLTGVEKLFLLQRNWNQTPQVPKVSADMVKGILQNIWNLKRLVISRESSQWDSIRDLISTSQGGLRAVDNCEMETLKKPHVGIDVVRGQLSTMRDETL